MTEPTLTTDRLRVWIIEASPTDDGDPAYYLVMACPTDIEWCGVAVSASVNRDGAGDLCPPGWVEWVQVSDIVREHGYGRELLESLASHWGMDLHCVTERGRKIVVRPKHGS